MSPRLIAKRIVQIAALVLVLPWAMLSALGRVRPIYVLFAHILAQAPGIVGDYLRAAYYRLTLRECSIDIVVGFGTILVHPAARIGAFVSIGSYCIIGRAHIGRRTQIASHVEIPSGRHQHGRDSAGQLLGSVDGETVIGSECWIGASAVVMATVGDRSTIGAGAVVVKDIPAGCVAVGNPARVLPKDRESAGK